MSEPLAVTVEDWVFRVRPPAGPAARAVLLAIHGRTGNEGSMEIFIQKLNRIFWVILPRAPYPAQGGGFSWVPEEKGIHQDFARLEASANGLNARVKQICQAQNIADLPVYLLGFSQGAALALAYSLRHAEVSDKIGLLSGFLPEGRAALPGSLAGYHFFAAHGRQDPTVPVEQARQAVRFLEASGAQVQYCEADTGHKLSMACFKQMEAYFFEA